MYQKIAIAGGATQPIPETEIHDAQRSLGTRFPAGYREFIETFGSGILSGFVRIYPPRMLLSGELSAVAWRRRVAEYWFWDRGPLKQERAVRCILIADTFNGDELVFDPAVPDLLYALPRHEEKSYLAGRGFAAAIKWMLQSGKLTDPIPDQVFEPTDFL